MRLAISNIAWDVTEDAIIANVLKEFGISAIDIAPSKYFSTPGQATGDDICRVKDWWLQHGIEITGMQSLMFGTSGLNMFGSLSLQKTMLAYLTEICRIGSELNATRLVFGSPKNRDRNKLSDKDTNSTAINFFRQLGDIAEGNGVLICLEPNPICYGANFMTTCCETVHIIEQVSHPAIKMQLDTGALTINKEDPEVILKDYAQHIGHIHASEPDLLPLGDGGANHADMYASLIKYLPNHIVSVEMLATKYELHENSIRRALVVAVQNYTDKSGSVS